jgi:rRNA-processing protein EBP2
MIRITEGFKLKDLPWIETMTVTSSKPIEVDVEDDMARELAFYQQALEAVQIGRELIKKAGVDFARPEDYYAEMLKSDEHMAKVKKRRSTGFIPLLTLCYRFAKDCWMKAPK